MIGEKILEFKKKHFKNEDVSLMDVIFDYAWENDIPIVELGKEIAEDTLFTEILENNLRRFGYLRGDKELKSIW